MSAAKSCVPALILRASSVQPILLFTFSVSARSAIEMRSTRHLALIKKCGRAINDQITSAAVYGFLLYFPHLSIFMFKKVFLVSEHNLNSTHIFMGAGLLTRVKRVFPDDDTASEGNLPFDEFHVYLQNADCSSLSPGRFKDCFACSQPCTTIKVRKRPELFAHTHARHCRRGEVCPE